MWVRYSAYITIKNLSDTSRSGSRRSWSPRELAVVSRYTFPGLTTGIISRRARCNLRSKFLMIFNQADAAARDLSASCLSLSPRLPLSFFPFPVPFRGKSFFLSGRSAKIFPRARIINSVLRGALNSSGNRCSYVLSPSLSSSFSYFSHDRDSFPRSFFSCSK